MFSFFKKDKSKARVDLSALQADMHSHLLPGIDDGVKTAGESISLIKGLQDLGYSRLRTTPHVMIDLYPNSSETIHRAYDKLQDEFTRTGFSFDIQPAAEYFLDDHFDQLLKSGKPLLPISKNLVLVEFSFVATPVNVKDKLFDMQIKGYQPVLAHPERYLYFARDKSQYEAFKSIGCLFQVNLLSLTGYYGKPTMDLAHYLVDHKFVDLLGTDMHHERHLDALRQSGNIMTPVNKLLDSGNILNSTL